MAKKQQVTINKSEQCLSCGHCADQLAEMDPATDEPVTIIICDLEDHAVEGSGTDCEHYKYDPSVEADHRGSDNEEDSGVIEDKTEDETIMGDKMVKAIFQGDSLVVIEKPRDGMELIEVPASFVGLWNTIVATMKQTTEEQVTELKKQLTEKLTKARTMLLESPEDAVLEGADALLGGNDSADEVEDEDGGEEFDDDVEDEDDEELDDDDETDDEEDDDEEVQVIDRKGLPEAIRNAEDGSTIMVSDGEVKKLGERSATAKSKSLKFEVADVEDDEDEDEE